MFLCPKCNKKLKGLKCTSCEYQIPQVNSIYQFCEATSIKLEGENQYIGYDSIGEDFEPASTYSDTYIERYGVYEACGDLIAKHFGKDITVFDLGAGLGTASIPLAKHGIYTIAADISNVMLSTAVKRANKRFDNLIFARMNAYEIMLADKTVDIVLENAMIHLVDNPEKVIKEIIRILKPGGCLVRYGSYPQKLSEEELKINQYCNTVLADISDKYDEYLNAHGYKSIDFNNHSMDIINKYFIIRNDGGEIAENFSEVFTDKLKFRLHRLKNGAYSFLQNTPKAILDASWEYASQYAKEKYGDDYIEIKGFSRYGAGIDIYLMKE